MERRANLPDHSKLEDVRKRFESLLWHDSELLKVIIAPAKEGHFDEVILHLSTWPGENKPRKQATLTIKECKIVQVTLDLECKEMCSNNIWDGDTFLESDWMKDRQQRRLREGFPTPSVESLTNFCHFRIRLIPPGGEINL